MTHSKTDGSTLSPAFEPNLQIDLDEIQLQARAAWFYYIGGLTQQDVANRLGITRLRVNRIIGQARADGLVHIDIRLPLASCVALEQAIKARYGLEAVSVVPALEDADAQAQIVGEAAGVVLQPLLQDGIRLGIGLGRSLRATVRRLKVTRMPRARVTALTGGLVNGSDHNSFDVCAEFVRTIGGTCSYITAPIYCPSAAVRDELAGHGGIADALGHARACDIAVISCGPIERNSILDHHPEFGRLRDSLRAAGAVGELLGTWLDASGGIVDHPLNACVIALRPPELKAVPRSILVASGLQKLPIARAVLRGGFVNTLVTDEAVASALLAA